MTTMQAVVTDVNAETELTLKTLPVPELGEYDVLVRVEAAAVNPVDAKQREAAIKIGAEKVLGFDGYGEVVAVGAAANKFKLGDKIYYAGQLGRIGSNAELQAVDEQIAALAPTKIDALESVAMPLTFLTAYELLHDQFGLTMEAGGAAGQSILIINGAGGVGSVMIQLAKWLGMHVIATASRPETEAWVRKMGADNVVSHRGDYVTAVRELGFQVLPYIAILYGPDQHIQNTIELVAPFGHVGAIVDPVASLDLTGMKSKAASLNWEFMFTKANAGYQVETQGAALAQLATLLDEGVLKSTLTEIVQGLDVATIKAAHDKVGAGRVMGKLAIQY